MKLDNFIFSAEAARIVGITKQAMSKLIHQGYFTTKSVAGRVLVLRSEVETFVARPKGRPTREAQARINSLRKSSQVKRIGNTGNYISQAEAARIRGVSKQAIADLIRRGRLTAVRAAGRTVVLSSEVEAFVPQPKTGRPPKKRVGVKAPERSKK
jgi:excisionase family DNA binding protein